MFLSVRVVEHDPFTGENSDHKAGYEVDSDPVELAMMELGNFVMEAAERGCTVRVADSREGALHASYRTSTGHEHDLLMAW